MSSSDPVIVAVTGLSGLVGSELLAAQTPGLRLIPLGDPPALEITDLRNFETALDACPGASVLLHLAAFTDTQRAWEQTDDRDGDCFRVNVLGTRHAARLCADRGLHLIYVSTDYVFRGDRDEPYGEADSPDPLDWYGKTKALGEHEAREAPSSTVVRMAFPYGPHNPGVELSRKLRMAWERTGNLKLFQDQFITPTWLGDIATGLSLLCRTRPRNETFHLAGAEWTTPCDFGLAAAPLLGIPPGDIQPASLAEAAVAGDRPRHRSLRLDISKWTGFASRHGLDPPLGIAAGLDRSRQALESRRAESSP